MCNTHSHRLLIRSLSSHFGGLGSQTRPGDGLSGVFILFVVALNPLRKVPGQNLRTVRIGPFYLILIQILQPFSFDAI